jgi:ubiquinone/menaquinone biosynthesis C-methylase UbiE
VLDVGTGLASLPLELIRRRPDLSIVGLDLSPAIVLAARDRVRRAGLHRRVHVRKAHGRRIPFARGSFDLVISDSFLHHLPDPVPVLDEMARVLAPRGRILIRDFRRPGPSRIEATIRRHGRRLPPEPFRLFADSVRAAFKVSEVREMIAESRLAGCRTRRRPGIYLVVEGMPRRRSRRMPRRRPRRR